MSLPRYTKLEKTLHDTLNCMQALAGQIELINVDPQSSDVDHLRRARELSKAMFRYLRQLRRQL